MLTLFYQMKMQKSRSEIAYDDFYRDALENIETKSRDDLSTKCRVCLSEATVPIHDLDDSEDIIEVLEIFTNIHLNDDNEYLKNLCTICFKFIKAGILFRKTAKLTERILNEPVKEEVELFDNFEDHDYSDNIDTDMKSNEQSIKKEKKEKIKHTAKVTCHICNKVINRSYYKEHMTMHDPDHKKYVCDICGKSFRLRCAYHNHSLRHRTDFPYKCQFCPYKGRYAELLKNHMRTHTGDYRYMCTVCPARFLFKTNLNSHMLKHKEPEFKCDACKRAFHTKLTLQRHYEADHLGIKNHVCSMCGKAFGYRNAMMKHQRHVHKREKLLFKRMPAYLQAQCQNL